jgi:hypothetical protein
VGTSVGEGGDDRHADEADRLVDRKGAPAKALGRKLTQIGADGHHLDAEANAGDEAPEVQARGVVLERDHDVGRRVPEKRPGEDRPAAEAVGEKVAKKRIAGSRSMRAEIVPALSAARPLKFMFPRLMAPAHCLALPTGTRRASVGACHASAAAEGGLKNRQFSAADQRKRRAP